MPVILPKARGGELRRRQQPDCCSTTPMNIGNSTERARRRAAAFCARVFEDGAGGRDPPYGAAPISAAVGAGQRRNVAARWTCHARRWSPLSLFQAVAERDRSRCPFLGDNGRVAISSPTATPPDFDRRGIAMDAMAPFLLPRPVREIRHTIEVRR